MKNILKISLTFLLTIILNLSYAQQDPKSSKDKKTTSADPGHKKDKKGFSEKIAVSDQAKTSEKSGAKKASDKDKVDIKK